MKIAIPTEEKNLSASVCPSFGRTPYFLIYDTESKECLYLDNSAASSQGGAGIKAAQAIADQGVRAILTPRCGENAEAVLSKAEILIYKTVPGTLKQNIDAFISGHLSLLAEIHPGFHGHEKQL